MYEKFKIYILMKVKELIKILKEVPEDASFEFMNNDESNEIEYFINDYRIDISIADENTFLLNVYVLTPEKWKSINNTQYDTSIICDSIKQCKEKTSKLIKIYEISNNSK